METPTHTAPPAAVHRLVEPLHLARDVGGKDGLQPLSRSAADDPSVSRGYRASKATDAAAKQILAAHFGVPISDIIVNPEDMGFRSLTACVDGKFFNVFFDQDSEIYLSLPA